MDDAEFGEMGQRLFALRLELSLTQKEFAKALGASLRTYHYYEKGQNQCSAQAMAILCETFGVDLNWFVSGFESADECSDVQRIAAFEFKLDEYVVNRAVQLTPQKRRAVVARWYQSSSTRRRELQGNAGFWLNLVG
jgi:transcriptional regulator with XRE-family HTH domain